MVLNIGNTPESSCNFCTLNLLTIKRIVTFHTLQLPFFISSSDRFTGATQNENGKKAKVLFHFSVVEIMKSTT
jgi:hypothetical protein